ncbi:hypothetical protein ABZ342_26400 [Amycolatopsis sp. NPDC005961]|uniref:hypothetical protein n=1 Tax=Amycolatopsis sp. NPDC005961 TaxID=3156720 RepID=UPI0033D18670
MFEQVSANVRALFSELGVSCTGAESAGVLVIDRFEHWSNPAGRPARPCATTITRIDEAWLDAA